MHVHFDPDTVDWNSLLRPNHHQNGGAYFIGRPYQRGGGFGSVLGGIFRFLLPALKSVGRELGREGLVVGSKVLGDLAHGKSLRSSIVEEGAAGLRNVIDRTNPSEGLRNLVESAESRLQRGKGAPRKRANPKTVTSNGKRRTARSRPKNALTPYNRRHRDLLAQL